MDDVISVTPPSWSDGDRIDFDFPVFGTGFETGWGCHERRRRDAEAWPASSCTATPHRRIRPHQVAVARLKPQNHAGQTRSQGFRLNQAPPTPRERDPNAPARQFTK